MSDSIRTDASRIEKLEQLKQLGLMIAEPTEEKEPSNIQCLLVSCPVCRAKPEYPCQITRIMSTTNSTNFIHAERRELAKIQLNALSNLDRALIVQYGFLIMADAVAANAEKMFNGTAYSTEQIKRFFAHKAIVELQELGLLR